MTAHATGRELGAFLRSRRGRVKPGEAGVREYGRRRVAGLRREELAELAGVSVSYYTRIEQGQARGVSASVLDALAWALRLDEDERAHLRRLACPDRERVVPSREQVRESVRTLVMAMEVPAVVLGRGMDVLAWNALAHALIGPHLAFSAPGSAATRPNWARLVFCDPQARERFADRTRDRRDVVGQLRFAAGRYPADPRIAEVVGELSAASREFVRLWDSHHVADRRPSVVVFRHPVLGEVELHHEAMRSPAAPDQLVVTFHAAPDTPHEAALGRLKRSLTRHPDEHPERATA